MSEDKEKEITEKTQEEEEAKKRADERREQQLAAIELRSDEVQEIMGYIPNWIIRWGITVIFIIIFVFIIGSVFFSYPDIIMSSVTVTTENPPAGIVARANGKIQQLFIKDKEEVKSGQNIAIIENASNYLHLFELKKKLAALEGFTPHYNPTGGMIFDQNFSLGELQTTYSVFLKSYSDYDYFIQLDYHNKTIASLRQQLEKHKLLVKGQERQNVIMQKEFQLSKEQYERSEGLFKDGIISKNDFEKAKSAYLQKEYSLEGARSSLANQKITVGQLEQNIMDMQLKHREQKKQMELSLNQSYDNLFGQIAQWEQNYLLKSPVDGVVAFTNYWSINQNVKAGETVFKVIPKNAGQIIGKVILPLQGSGKVEEGQEVNIKFMNFPYMDYGMVRGVIKTKSLVAADNNYVLEVHLPEGLITSYGEELPFSQEMVGTAEIITEDIKLIERIFKPIKNILEKM